MSMKSKVPHINPNNWQISMIGAINMATTRNAENFIVEE